MLSCDILILYFLIPALNDLDILVEKTQNIYLNNPTKEGLFFYTGDELRSDQGKVVIIVRPLYDLKSSAFAWRNIISEILDNHLGFQ